MRKILILLLVVLVAIQFIRPEKNQSAIISGQDITNIVAVPEDVMAVLKPACYDCHSNNTVYPWYSNIQPVAWWLGKHIRNGKKHLNFSEFGAYSKDKKVKKMREIEEVIEENEMPLKSYTLIHKHAVLNGTQKKLLIDWAKTTVIR